MNRKLIIAACMALVLAGCGDKNEPATGSAEPGMMDKAIESTSEMAEDAGEMASDAGHAMSETAGDIAEGASDMASDAYEATKETIHDAAQGVADATATECRRSGSLKPGCHGKGSDGPRTQIQAVRHGRSVVRRAL